MGQRITKSGAGSHEIGRRREARDDFQVGRQGKALSPKDRIGSQPGSSGDSTTSSSSDESSESGPWRDEKARRDMAREITMEGTEGYSGDTGRSMGVQGMMRAYVGKKKLTGAWH